MTYKNRFKTSVDEYKKVKEDLVLQNGKLSKDDKEKIKEINKLHQEEINKLKTNLREILSDKRSELGLTDDKKVDKDYDLRLKNLQGVFSKDGKEMSEKNITKGLVLFTEDPVALYSLRQSLNESGRPEDEVEELIPLDKEDFNMARLGYIENSLDDRLKIALGAEVNDYLGYESILATLD